MQQAAAASVPEGKPLRPRLFLELIRRPLWLAGIAMSAFSYVVQGRALAFGSLVLVPPLAAMDLVFALPMVAWRRRVRITLGEAAGAVCTAGGVAVFLWRLPRSTGIAAPGVWNWVPLLAFVCVCVGVLVPAGLRRQGGARTALYASAAGVLFALLDSLTKSAADLFRDSGIGALAHALGALCVALRRRNWAVACSKFVPGWLPGDQSADHRRRGPPRRSCCAVCGE
ncbi:DMT family transporter [Streptomyces silvisoli]|uniref:DMT family transporter n=1 Tax=Streptomyces silvisoli TaxID=3034235 RepID=UPI003703F5C5